MPVRKVQGGYRWGNSGKVYPTKAQAELQGRAIYASGYQDGGIVDVTQGDDPSTVDRVHNFMTDRFGLPVTTDWERPEKPMLTPAQTAYLAAGIGDPTVMTGLVDVTGGYPSFPGRDVPLSQAFSGEPMPSVAENVREGNLGIAALQTLGLIPGIGMVTRGRRVAKAASDVLDLNPRNAKKLHDQRRALDEEFVQIADDLEEISRTRQRFNLSKVPDEDLESHFSRLLFSGDKTPIETRFPDFVGGGSTFHRNPEDLREGLRYHLREGEIIPITGASDAAGTPQRLADDWREAIKREKELWARRGSLASEHNYLTNLLDRLEETH